MRDILLVKLLHGSSMLASMPILVSALKYIQLISVLRKHLVFGHFSCSLFFIGQPSGSKPTGTDRNGPNFRIGQECAGLAQLQYWSRLASYG